jgi:hypothetical protein
MEEPLHCRAEHQHRNRQHQRDPETSAEHLLVAGVAHVCFVLPFVAGVFRHRGAVQVTALVVRVLGHRGAAHWLVTGMIRHRGTVRTAALVAGLLLVLRMLLLLTMFLIILHSSSFSHCVHSR